MQRLLLVVAVPLILMLAMAVAGISSSCAVSYTHLTLPTTP